MADYRVNGVSLADAVNFIADSSRVSSNSFEKFHDPKPVFSHTYDDENGTDIDLVSPVFDQARSFRIEGVIVASSEADYKSKKAAFKQAFNPRLLTIYVDEIDETVNATLKAMPTFERLTKVRGETKIAAKVAVELDEVMGTALPTYDLFYGPSSSIPTTEAQVLALTQGVFANEVEFETGTTQRYFTMALQVGASITSVTDLDSVLPNITSLYTLRGTVLVGAVTYNIYSMEVAVPYSPSHTHKFILA